MQKIIENISYENLNNELVGRVDIPDLTSRSSIIVNESQEALFYKDGQALDLFDSGRHEINTESLPLFKKIFKNLFGTKSAIPCIVYYISKVNVMDLMWGTPSPITLEDPKYHLIVNVGANGTMGVRIVDSRKFVVKIVGQMPSWSADEIKRAIKGVMLVNIKNCISNAIIREGVSILEIQTHLLSLSETIKKAINDIIVPELGVELINFYINTISATESDLAILKETRERYMSAMTDIDIEAIKTVRMGQAQAQSRAAQGFTYADERRFDVLEGAAKNEGVSGTFMGAGMGLGMGAGLGASIGGAAAKTSEALTASANMVCPKCNASVPAGSKFCPQCGEKMEPIAKFCPQCGTKIADNAKFCPQCGTKIGE